MVAKYKAGQKIIVTPVTEQRLSPEGSDIKVYAGKSGRVREYYWLNTGRGSVFYIYTVRMDTDNKDIVLHEDEMQPYI